MARHDSLTQLPNRVLVARSGWPKGWRASTAWEPMAVFYLDLDNFRA